MLYVHIAETHARELPQEIRPDPRQRQPEHAAQQHAVDGVVGDQERGVTKVKLKNVNQGRYWYETTMTVRDSKGTPIWEGNVYTEWNAYGSNRSRTSRLLLLRRRRGAHRHRWRARDACRSARVHGSVSRCAMSSQAGPPARPE